MALHLYNTLTRTKQVFTPADPNRVTLYICGPTVNKRAHIGNARPPVVFDVLRRLLQHLYGAAHVVYASNITDVDDKINAEFQATGVPIAEIAAKAEKYYFEDLAALGVTPPDIIPRATAHIPQMIALMEKLIASGHAYAAEGHVLFNVTAFADYGKLSKRNRDDMIAGARVEIAPYKRDPADFVMWKPSSDDLPGWDSPWGRGRPGWHIECSAMIAEHLGATIDIHGGGQDLIFPHHENEIAQSECGHGAPLARYWLHNGFLSMDKEKMSKSLGNVALVSDMLASGVKGEVMRFALLSAHYRQPLDWSDALVAQAKATLDRLYGFLRGQTVEAGKPTAAFMEALYDDLNTPKALSVLSQLGNSRDLPSLKASAALLGLLQQNAEIWFQGVIGTIKSTVMVNAVGHGEVGFTDNNINVLINERNEAKKSRNFATADRIRDQLKAEGIILEDSKDGTTWKRA
jgi:cysteinyl-tRNA synthetase